MSGAIGRYPQITPVKGANDAQGVQDRLSLSAVYIRLLFDDTALACGSAFLWRYEGKAYLVSNWHNFTGRNAITKKPISPTGGIPNRVECYFYKDRVSNGKYIDEGQLLCDSWSFPLIDDSGHPLFLEHPLGNYVDVAALPVELHEYVVPFYLNEQNFDYYGSLYPGQDVFIIGYPLGLITNTPFPIWKRGTIASEPYILIDGMNKMLVDTASREGMSGSFVIVQRPSIVAPIPHIDPSIVGPTAEVERAILGIYSGRIGASQLEAQLGVVWPREAIERVLSKGRRAEMV
jgi:hypothetical protein